MCFYEYASQIFVQTFKGASGRVLCFPFEPTHPLYSTHIQVSVGFRQIAKDAVLMW
jgi:hypothetical protein